MVNLHQITHAKNILLLWQKKDLSAESALNLADFISIVFTVKMNLMILHLKNPSNHGHI